MTVWASRNLLPTVAMLGFAMTTAIGQEAGDDCLYANSPSASASVPTTSNSDDSICQPDSLHMSDQALVLNAMRAFGVSNDRVRFLGCYHTPFRTVVIGKGTSAVYNISYPTPVDGSSADYLAPIVHELGHVFQLEQSGSREALRARLLNSSERIELGADFLAGVAYQLNQTLQDRGEFERSLRLVGSYRDTSSAPHGTPLDRLQAFRLGFYHKLDAGGIKAAERDFQFNGFSRLKANSGPKIND